MARGQQRVGQVPSNDAQFRALYDAHYGIVRDYCARRVPATQLADAISDVFAVVWRRLDSAPVGDDLTRWLYGIARNVVRNHARSGRRIERLRGRISREPVRTGEDPSNVVVRSEQSAEVLSLLAELRPRDQELLRLRAWEGLSSADIGTILGISPDAVDMRLVRVRRKLADRASSTTRRVQGGER